MRLVDADALKEAMYQNGGCGICSMYVDDAPTIDAIPVEWLNEMKHWAAADGDSECVHVIAYLLDRWQEEQEAQDG